MRAERDSRLAAALGLGLGDALCSGAARRARSVGGARGRGRGHARLAEKGRRRRRAYVFCFCSSFFFLSLHPTHSFLASAGFRHIPLTDSVNPGPPMFSLSSPSTVTPVMPAMIMRAGPRAACGVEGCVSGRRAETCTTEDRSRGRGRTHLAKELGHVIGDDVVHADVAVEWQDDPERQVDGHVERRRGRHQCHGHEAEGGEGRVVVHRGRHLALVGCGQWW
jgi:hypothetical protein